jgi:hypothetical protein
MTRHIEYFFMDVSNQICALFSLFSLCYLLFCFSTGAFPPKWPLPIPASLSTFLHFSFLYINGEVNPCIEREKEKG